LCTRHASKLKSHTNSFLERSSANHTAGTQPMPTEKEARQ
jgi:hypothetical protein